MGQKETEKFLMQNNAIILLKTAHRIYKKMLAIYWERVVIYKSQMKQ